MRIMEGSAYTAARKLAVNNDDTKAMLELGIALVKGDGVKANEEEGNAWIQEAARNGGQEAQAYLAEQKANTEAEQLKLAADTIRCLCADMVEKANSGHPGAAMGMADMAVTLWLKHLNVDPRDPAWKNRDRLVFSGGHASTLVYALTHLAGTGGLSMDELQTFRQFGSRCAGHPERGVMPGVEVTTGPLGQGFAMAVGLAIGAKMKKRPIPLPGCMISVSPDVLQWIRLTANIIGMTCITAISSDRLPLCTWENCTTGKRQAIPLC